MKRIRNIFVILVFLFILVILSATTLCREKDSISLTENRTLAQFKRPHISTVLNSEFQNNLEDAFADQFILRNKSLEAYKKGKSKLTNFVYNFIDVNENENSMLLIPIADDIFKVGNNGDYLVEFPTIWTSYYNEQVYKRDYNYNDIASTYPDVDFYIYRVTNAMDTDWFDEENQVTTSGLYYDNIAKENLSKDITFKYLDIKNWDYYKEIHYKTDHHWNYLGAYQGYQDIINMIGEKHKEVGEPKKPSSLFCSDAKFYGSYVKRSNFNLDENVYDTLCEFIYDDVKDYKVYVNDEEVEEFGNRTSYRNGIYDLEKGTNHYRDYFGKDSAKVVYDFGDNTGVNAIFFTDSYTNAIRPELASHFDKTYFIDLRYYYEEYGDFFSLRKALTQENIDVVVYVGSTSVCFMDDVYMINYY